MTMMTMMIINVVSTAVAVVVPVALAVKTTAKAMVMKITPPSIAVTMVGSTMTKQSLTRLVVHFSSMWYLLRSPMMIRVHTIRFSFSSIVITHHGFLPFLLLYSRPPTMLNQDGVAERPLDVI